MGILDYFRRRTVFQRLYEHWLEEDMPSADGPQDSSGTARRSLDGELEDISPPQARQAARRRVSREAKPREADTVQWRVPIRYLLVGVGLIALLLVTLSVVATVLVMRSC